MLRQARFVLVGAIAIGCSMTVLQAPLEARGGPGLASRSTLGDEPNRGYRQEVTGSRGIVSSAAAFSYVPAAPVSLRWVGGRY